MPRDDLAWLSEMPRDLAGWPAALRALAPPDAKARALAIVHAWIDGSLHDARRPLDPRAIDRDLAAVMAAIGELAPDELTRDGRGEADHDTRRWCWIECWTMSEQDEDLLMMREEHGGSRRGRSWPGSPIRRSPTTSIDCSAVPPRDG